MLFEFLLGIIGEFISVTIFQNIIAPIFRVIGGSLRFLFTFDNSSFKKENNGLLGLLFSFVTTILIIIIWKNLSSF